MEEINRPRSLKEIAAERIREAIVEGRLKMGESLSENFLAQNLQVSKTPIREALSLLNMEGLVNIVPQKGTFVFSMEKPEIIELCELRFALESLALRYSHERNREPFLKDLERLFKLMRKNQKKENQMKYLELDDQFHKSFFNHCENRYMKDTYRMINARVAALRNYISGEVETQPQQSHEQHESILEALKKDNIDECMKILENHIINWLKKVDIHPAYADKNN
ncbi:MAG: GntR family transcriptional regulator [Deltaproteobacteria bacterium]